MNPILAAVFLALCASVSFAQENTKTLETGWYVVTDSTSGQRMQHPQRNQDLFVDPTPIVTKNNMRACEIQKVTWPAPGAKYELIMWLDEQGTKSWAVATKEASLTEKDTPDLAFILDDSVVCTLTVMRKISTGATAIWGEHLSKKELRRMMKRLRE